MTDREKVIAGLESQLDDLSKYADADEVLTLTQNQAKDILTLLKEQERKKGSWDYGTKCSVCKGTIIPPKDRKVRVNFCPWCGADMRDSYEQEGR